MAPNRTIAVRQEEDEDEPGFTVGTNGPELRIFIPRRALHPPGDVLVLAEWDRATRSMWDGLQIVKQVLDAGATIRVLDFPSLDLTTPESRGFPISRW